MLEIQGSFPAVLESSRSFSTQVTEIKSTVPTSGLPNTGKTVTNQTELSKKKTNPEQLGV